MKWSRALAALGILAALAVGTANATCSTRTFPVVGPCTSSALSAAYSGASPGDRVDAVNSFGCVGTWAYLWATIGKGVGEVGVTDVLHFDDTTNKWQNASRLRYCMHQLLPAYVEFWGCNSN
jgi:hypothetical protein